MCVADRLPGALWADERANESLNDFDEEFKVWRFEGRNIFKYYVVE